MDSSKLPTNRANSNANVQGSPVQMTMEVEHNIVPVPPMSQTNGDRQERSSPADVDIHMQTERDTEEGTNCEIKHNNLRRLNEKREKLIDDMNEIAAQSDASFENCTIQINLIKEKLISLVEAATNRALSVLENKRDTFNATMEGKFEEFQKLNAECELHIHSMNIVQNEFKDTLEFVGFNLQN